ncbi:hypothetical protein TNCV_3849201 [Trichonephila clavipes]|uniref:Uncharacterized protein n=1 Tax=Trichonephila clavipes TaxID=2585209 RepID=A0A8X6RH39_TRICX|nr:hypothetical protein TNCV_3849201 [Trichonephila clavipes]
MSKQTRKYKFLEDINNIGEEELSENEDILVANENEIESTDTDDEEENIGNICCGQKRIRLLLMSEESEAGIKEQHVANDGSVWEEIQVPGRTPLHNIFCQEVGPTGYAKRHVMKAGINTWILYKQTTGENNPRQDFLLKLAVELGTDFREAREQRKRRINTKGSLPKSTTDAHQQIEIIKMALSDHFPSFDTFGAFAFRGSFVEFWVLNFSVDCRFSSDCSLKSRSKAISDGPCPFEPRLSEKRPTFETTPT